MADKPKVKPSSAGVWIGLVMILLSIVSCGAGCVLAGSEVKDAADSAKRVEVPSSQSYEFEANAAGIIVGFAKSSSEAKAIDVKLTDESGNEVKLETNSSFSSSSSSSSDGDAVEVLGAFEAKSAGTYTLTSTGTEGAQVAILNISISSILTKFFGGAIVGAILFIVGLILAIVTGVRRGRAKKKAAAGGYGGPPPAGFPSNPPAPSGFPSAPPAPPAPGGGYPPAPPAPPAQPVPDGGYAPAPPAPPAPGGGYPPAPPAPPAAFPPPPAPPAPPTAPGQAPPPPPGQWGNDQPPAAPPFS